MNEERKMLQIQLHCYFEDVHGAVAINKPLVEGGASSLKHRSSAIILLQLPNMHLFFKISTLAHAPNEEINASGSIMKIFNTDIA